MAGNSNLARANREKNDEFYTRLTDIEKELRHYRKHFKDKVVLCNCDDPYESNFFKYFVLNFNVLGLKKLIATCYGTSPIANEQISLFDISGDIRQKGRPCLLYVTKVYDTTGDGGIDMSDIINLFKNRENELTELKGDGDFRSEECIELLKEADIVVTNPPFSLFREYIANLMRYNKKFVIMGNKNAITYKEMFPLLKEDKVWVGATSLNGGRWMIMPNNIEIKSKKTKIDENGDVILNVAGVCWFTNLDINKRHEDLILVKRYNEEDYPKYDNYDAINVNKVTEIPYDYEGAMGVPITFMDKHNPDQFEIIGLLQSSTDEQAGIPNLRYYNEFKEMRQDMSYTKSSGGKANGNPVLKGKSKRGNFLYNEKTNEYVHSVYARILVRNKHPEPQKEFEK